MAEGMPFSEIGACLSHSGQSSPCPETALVSQAHPQRPGTKIASCTPKGAQWLILLPGFFLNSALPPTGARLRSRCSPPSARVRTAPCRKRSFSAYSRRSSCSAPRRRRPPFNRPLSAPGRRFSNACFIPVSGTTIQLLSRRHRRCSQLSTPTRMDLSL